MFEAQLVLPDPALTRSIYKSALNLSGQRRNSRFHRLVDLALALLYLLLFARERILELRDLCTRFSTRPLCDLVRENFAHRNGVPAIRTINGIERSVGACHSDYLLIRITEVYHKPLLHACSFGPCHSEAFRQKDAAPPKAAGHVGAADEVNRWHCGSAGLLRGACGYPDLLRLIPTRGVRELVLALEHNGDQAHRLLGNAGIFRPEHHVAIVVVGLPGKPEGMSGAEVEKYYRDGHISQIAEYCESDVVNTYQLWLRHELFCGKLTGAAFQASETNLAEFTKARGNTKPHLADFVL
jgi:hypothetical protein